MVRQSYRLNHCTERLGHEVRPFHLSILQFWFFETKLPKFIYRVSVFKLPDLKKNVNIGEI
jgi:hypothetical protein